MTLKVLKTNLMIQHQNEVHGVLYRMSDVLKQLSIPNGQTKTVSEWLEDEGYLVFRYAKRGTYYTDLAGLHRIEQHYVGNLPAVKPTSTDKTDAVVESLVARRDKLLQEAEMLMLKADALDDAIKDLRGESE